MVASSTSNISTVAYSLALMGVVASALPSSFEIAPVVFVVPLSLTVFELSMGVLLTSHRAVQSLFAPKPSSRSPEEYS